MKRYQHGQYKHLTMRLNRSLRSLGLNLPL